MKKYLLCLMAIVVIVSTNGCGSANLELSNVDYELSNNTTSKGITIGSSSDDFINAYDGLEVSVIYADSGSNTGTFMDIDKVDYSKQGVTAIQNFFVDDKPYTVDEIKNKYNIKNDINAWLQNNPKFLEKHSLTYKCLTFYFDNGIIVDIKYSEKNFNE